MIVHRAGTCAARVSENLPANDAHHPRCANGTTRAVGALMKVLPHARSSKIRVPYYLLLARIFCSICCKPWCLFPPLHPALMIFFGIEIKVSKYLK